MNVLILRTFLYIALKVPLKPEPSGTVGCAPDPVKTVGKKEENNFSSEFISIQCRIHVPLQTWGVGTHTLVHVSTCMCACHLLYLRKTPVGALEAITG